MSLPEVVLSGSLDLLANHFVNSQNTQMPWLDYLWRDNPLVPVSSKRNPLAEFGAARIMERMGLNEDGRRNISQRDFLSCFIKEKAKDNTLPDM